MPESNYPAGVKAQDFENPMAELREQVEADADISYELRVIVEGELVDYKRTRLSSDIVAEITAAEDLVSQKIDELTELRAEQEKEANNG